MKLSALIVLLVAERGHLAFAEYAQMSRHSLRAYPDARCLDGTPGTYYHSPGVDTGHSKWYIELQGGGWCGSINQCAARLNTPFGSSTSHSESFVRRTPFFDDDPSENPLMHNWNKVYIRYCDGFSFLGGASDSVIKDGQLMYFRGSTILQSSISDLLQNENLDSATDIIIGGCSAGGFAAITNCDRLATQVKAQASEAKVVCASESGFFVNYDQSGVSTYEDLMSQGMALHEPVLPPKCLAKLSNQLDCLLAENVMKHTEVPVFVMQSIYDDWARGSIMLSNGDDDEINAFGIIVEDKILDSVMIEPVTKNQNGVYIDSCQRHCNGYDVQIDSLKKVVALQAWYENGMEGVDNTHIQSERYPCEDCCGLPKSCGPRDMFGHEMMYHSDASKTTLDWHASWENLRTLSSPPVGADPQDDRTEVRGTGNITISSGSATLTNSAELYMRAKAAGSPSPGFENIEFTGYARYVQDGDVKPASGFNMIAPTNYSGPRDDGCNSRYYQAQIRRDNGKVSFFKRGSKNSYSARNQASLPSMTGSSLSDWIGMKFVVLSNHEGEEDMTLLELYVDLGDGKGWRLAHSFEDKAAEWKTTKDIPAECGAANDDHIFGEKNYVGISNIGNEETMVEWRQLNIRNVSPEKYLCADPAPTQAPTPTPTPISPTPTPEKRKVKSTKITAVAIVAFLTILGAVWFRLRREMKPRMNDGVQQTGTSAGRKIGIWYHE